MKKKYMRAIFAFFIFPGLHISGQVLPPPVVNGSVTTQEYVDSIIANLDEEKAFAPDTTDTKILIQAYKFRNELGILTIDDLTIYQLVNETNQYFRDANIYFHVEDIEIVDDYNYGIIDGTQVNDELFTLHSAANMINLYFVQINPMPAFEYSGFSYYPDEPDKNYVFLNINYAYGNYLTNVMGTYFGLLPTHDTIGGIEHVYDKNCEESGDFLCDTYADPNLMGLVDPQCYYMGSNIDPLGAYYIPTVSNFMNFGLDECKCVFTEEQLKRIQFTYYKYRHYLQ